MLPQHKGQKELGTQQLFQGMHASMYPQAGKGPSTVSKHRSFSHPSNRHLNNRNRLPLSPRKVPDSNKNSPLKINESKGHQPNNTNVRRKSCLQPSQRSLAPLWNKGSFCDSKQQVVERPGCLLWPPFKTTSSSKGSQDNS